LNNEDHSLKQLAFWNQLEFKIIKK